MLKKVLAVAAAATMVGSMAMTASAAQVQPLDGKDMTAFFTVTTSEGSSQAMDLKGLNILEDENGNKYFVDEKGNRVDLTTNVSYEDVDAGLCTATISAKALEIVEKEDGTKVLVDEDGTETPYEEPDAFTMEQVTINFEGEGATQLMEVFQIKQKEDGTYVMINRHGMETPFTFQADQEI